MQNRALLLDDLDDSEDKTETFKLRLRLELGCDTMPAVRS